MNRDQLLAKCFESPDALRTHRRQVRLSQMRLAKVAGVQAWKIVRFELGEIEADRLTDAERGRIADALQAEVLRLRSFTFGETAVTTEGGHCGAA
jgi:predicted transcriptional regulator